MTETNKGTRGTKEILTRFPEDVGLEADERHEGIEIALTSETNNTPVHERVGLNA